MEQLEKFFADLFLKKITYQIPVKGKEFIVQVAPWATIIALVLCLPAILAVFGVGSMLTNMGVYLGVHFGFRYYLGIAILAVQVVLMAMSISGLMKREIIGWKYAYYFSLVAGVYGIISSYNVSGMIWSILSTAVGLYIIFQVKSYYK